MKKLIFSILLGILIINSAFYLITAENDNSTLEKYPTNYYDPSPLPKPVEFDTIVVLSDFNGIEDTITLIMPSPIGKTIIRVYDGKSRLAI
jgi:hypothetical protein